MQFRRKLTIRIEPQRSRALNPAFEHMPTVLVGRQSPGGTYYEQILETMRYAWFVLRVL